MKFQDIKPPSDDGSDRHPDSNKVYIHNPLQFPTEFIEEIASKIDERIAYYDVIRLLSDTFVVYQKMGDRWVSCGIRGLNTQRELSSNLKTLETINKKLAGHILSKPRELTLTPKEDSVEISKKDYRKATKEAEKVLTKLGEEMPSQTESDKQSTFGFNKIWRDFKYGAEFRDATGKKRFKVRYDYLNIHKPTLPFLKKLAKIIRANGGSFSASYIEVAVDYSFASHSSKEAEHLAYELQGFFLAYNTKRYSRSTKIVHKKSVRYFESKTKSSNIVLYSDRPGKFFTSTNPATHLEFRLKRRTIKSVFNKTHVDLQDLINLDLREFAKKRLVIRCLTIQWLVKYYGGKDLKSFSGKIGKRKLESLNLDDKLFRKLGRHLIGDNLEDLLPFLEVYFGSNLEVETQYIPVAEILAATKKLIPKRDFKQVNLGQATTLLDDELLDLFLPDNRQVPKVHP